jgi:hypothetical protein
VLDWSNISPEDFLTTPGLLADEPVLEAAPNARRFARAGKSDYYDDIGFRSMAATLTPGPVPLQTMSGMHFQRESEQRKQLTPELEDLLDQQRKLRHRPLELPKDGRFRYEVTDDSIDFFVAFGPSDTGETPDVWTFPLSAPPKMIIEQLAEEMDVPMLFTQYGRIDVPSFWLPINALIAAGKFRRMQQWRAELAKSPQAGCFYAFVSHRWLSTAHPDPDETHARFLSWQIVGHLCEAIRIASLRGLDSPRAFSRMLGFAMGIHGSDLAESLIVNVLRHNLDEASLEEARKEVIGIEDRLDDHGLAEAVAEDAMPRLRKTLEQCPVLTALLECIFVWYDYSCMPQAPRTEEEDREFREGLQSLIAIQAMSRTLVLLDGVEDYLSRAWCTLEAIVADTQLMSIDLLVGSYRATARDGRIEYFFEHLLEDRPHLVWRAILDTEVFGLQSWRECMRRLKIATTEAPDLPFTYEELVKLSAPTKVHVDASELITGVVPLPVIDNGNAVLWARKLARSVKIAANRDTPQTLDWTNSLRIESGWGRDGGHSAAEQPPSIRLADRSGDASQTQCHAVIIGSCEGEAVMLSRWVREHAGELERLVGASIDSMTWLASDIAPVGHFAHGNLSAEAIGADVWVVVSLSVRFTNCTLTGCLVDMLAASTGTVVTVAVDKSENNVSVVSRDGDADSDGDGNSRTEESDKFRRLLIPSGGFPVVSGGLFRGTLTACLVPNLPDIDG